MNLFKNPKRIVLSWELGAYYFGVKFEEGPSLSFKCGPDPHTAVAIIKANNIQHFDYGNALTMNTSALESFLREAKLQGVGV